MNKTSIEWTHRPDTTGMTWNPIRARRNQKPLAYWQCPNGSHHELSMSGQKLGKEHPYCKVCPERVYAVFKADKLRTGTFCTRISPGCQHCYASTINKRFGTGLEFTVPNMAAHEFYIDQRILEQPLKRRKPATIFVGDMFDLFHEAIPAPFVGRVFGMMAKCPQHTFQLLTKRTEYMQAILSRAQNLDCGAAMPLPNVWIGTSVESQKYADERIPLLLQTPAAVRFLSVEPLLEAVDLYRGGFSLIEPVTSPQGEHWPGVNWVIVGGESGPGARPFNLRWAESLLDQCKRAGVPFFMKQIGSRPGYIRKDVWADYYSKGKGGDMQYWPEALRVREFPA